MFGRFDDGRPAILALAAKLLDLDDQDDGVADQDADQRQDTEDGDEAEGGSARNERADGCSRWSSWRRGD